MMKNLFGVYIFLLVLSLSATAYPQGPSIPVKKRVAVADFTIRDSGRHYRRGAREFARTATEKVINAFAGLNRFSIVDRTVVKRIQAEKQIQMLGYASAPVKANLGAVAKADIYCTGQVQNVSVARKYDTKNKFLGYDADVELQIKIYDLAAGTLVCSKDVRGGTEIGGGVLSLLSFYQDTPSKAVLKALNNAERRIRDYIDEAFPIEGKIVDIIERNEGGERFLITLGSNLGFTSKNKLAVIETSQIRVDGVLYPKQNKIGELKITKVAADGIFSEAKPVSNNGQTILQKYESGYNLIIRSEKR